MVYRWKYQRGDWIYLTKQEFDEVMEVSDLINESQKDRKGPRPQPKQEGPEIGDN